MGGDGESSAADAPRIGVVIPTLDEAGNLPGLLQRLQGEASGSTSAEERIRADTVDELVVVDGGSRDGTREVARRFGARVLEVGRGRGVQLAAGARLLESDVLLFLHADSTPAIGAIGALREAYRNPRILWTSMAQSIDGGGRIYRWIERAANARARRGHVYGDCGLGVRRRVYMEVGGFADIPIFEDVDLCDRLRRQGPVAWLGEARLTTSARRWKREGPLRCTLRNWWLRIGFRLGMPPSRLARCYPPQSELDAKA